MATAPTNSLLGKKAAELRYALADCERRARTARGPSAAQAADRSAARIRAELQRRDDEMEARQQEACRVLGDSYDSRYGI